MARNLYILAGTLLLLALVCFGMTLSANAPGLPSEAPTWKTIALFLLLGSLVVALLGTLTALFEQVDRRAALKKARDRQRGSRG